MTLWGWAIRKWYLLFPKKSRSYTIKVSHTALLFILGVSGKIEVTVWNRWFEPKRGQNMGLKSASEYMLLFLFDSKIHRILFDVTVNILFIHLIILLTLAKCQVHIDALHIFLMWCSKSFLTSLRRPCVTNRISLKIWDFTPKNATCTKAQWLFPLLSNSGSQATEPTEELEGPKWTMAARIFVFCSVKCPK